MLLDSPDHPFVRFEKRHFALPAAADKDGVHQILDVILPVQRLDKAGMQRFVGGFWRIHFPPVPQGMKIGSENAITAFFPPVKIFLLLPALSALGNGASYLFR